MLNLEELPPLSLYVHIPWCLRKCPYCDFNSHAADLVPEADYVRALLQDLRDDSRYAQGRTLRSIFIGGGTPSLFSPAAIATIIDAAENAFGFADDIEITLEANPGTAEQNKFRGFLDAGVNRLSIGAQSFHSRHLARLGRIHSAGEALRAVDIAHTAGFDRINIDLMHGLPEQTPRNAIADLEQALALQPQHISWYQLTIEPNTEFHRRPPVLPLDDVLVDIQQRGQDCLHAAGFQQYEVSAYARPGESSRHNRNYWEFGDYLGIGAGAHSKISLHGVSTQGRGTIRRHWKTRHPDHYLDPDRNFTAGVRIVEPAALPLEFMMNALRLTRGVPAVWFSRRTGLPLAMLEPALGRLRDRGLMVAADDAAAETPEHRLAATPLGLRFLNTLLESFVAE